jgi:hypothetical protein
MSEETETPIVATIMFSCVAVTGSVWNRTLVPRPVTRVDSDRPSGRRPSDLTSAKIIGLTGSVPVIAGLQGFERRGFAH